MGLPTWPHDASPFHHGEQSLQDRIGAREQAERGGRRMIRGELIEQHRAFFGMLPALYVGHVAQNGQIWASMLSAAPGFLSSPDPHTLRVQARPGVDEVLNQHVQEGAQVGLLGIQLSTRRRNRLNGRISQVDPQGFSLQVAESYGNCPKFIRARALLPGRSPSSAPAQSFLGLPAQHAKRVRASDTFFVASAASMDVGMHSGNADVSHRGGPPGFVEVQGDTLIVPDYAGNRLFNTLGNFMLNPRAGLLFVDFESGDLLQLTGSVTLDLESADIERFPDAKRLWSLRVEAGRFLPARSPLRWHH